MIEFGIWNSEFGIRESQVLEFRFECSGFALLGHTPVYWPLLPLLALMGQEPAPAGWHDLQFSAPASAWWIGSNELRLSVAASVKPRDVGAGDDPRPLSLALSRVDVH